MYDRRKSRFAGSVGFNQTTGGGGDVPKNPQFHQIQQRRLSRAPPGFGRGNLANLLKARDQILTPEQEETLDDEELFSRLQKIFDAKQEEAQTGLTIDEFKDAMRKTVGRHSTQDEIELLFMKVDANCDRVVDWDEYVTYNLIEYKEKTFMIEMLREKPFPNEIRDIESRHRDLIVKILFYPTLRKSGSVSGSIDPKAGKYMTLSKEGVLGVWSMGMRNLKYYNANHYQKRNTQPWFTDMVAMYNVNMLALTSTERDITMFDMSGKKFSMRYFLTGFDSCITAMDYWVDHRDLNNAVLMLGDQSGSVYCLKFNASLRGGLFGPVSGKKNTCKRVSFPEVIRGFSLGVKVQKFADIHNDWVNKVLYLPMVNGFLSSCQDAQTALYFGDLVGKKTPVYFKVNKGVLSFDYSQALNIIVTGGMDYFLRVWNPYVNNKAIVLLKGHTKPVNHVIINDSKNQVISIDKGRSMRVYDLRDQTCLQQISGRMINFDPFPISAVYFNPAMRTTLLAANTIAMLEKREEEDNCTETVSHIKPVVAALYSSVFDSTITACQESVVSIWDTNTGIKQMQFVNAHYTVERGVEIPVEITALCFDYNGRRLVTGARNGTVHVWNFNNGSLLQAFALPDASSVTGIVSTAHNFYVSGWGKQVYVYIDGGGEEDRKEWKMRHKEDILCITHLSPNIIATGGYDGDVFIWSRDTGQVYCRLNANESVKPVSEQIKRHTTVPAIAESEDDDVANLPSENTDKDDDGDISMRLKRKAKITGVVALLGMARRFKAPTEATPSSDDEERCEHPLLNALDSEHYSAKAPNLCTRKEYDLLCKHYESAVEKIIFLETREPLHKDTAIIVTGGAEGWIRFWSMHHDGGLLGQFNAAHRLGESILTIKCDAKEHYLFTGDTQGYVKIWDIKDYSISKKMSNREKKARIELLKRKFTFFRVENYDAKIQAYTVPEHLKNVFAGRPPPSASDPEKTLRYPPLLNSFQAHTRSIHSVDYVSDREILITASADCSVRVWTINGQYIGTFGGGNWHPLPKVVNDSYFLSQVPIDIRRSGSARTLKVIHGGKTPMWEGALDILKQRGMQRLQQQFDHLQPSKERKTPDVAVRASSSFETSNILGKSYKRTTRHRMAPKIPRFIETPGSVAVYHTLPFVDLTPIDVNNSDLRELKQRRAENFALSRLRGQQVRKQEVPAILTLYNKIAAKSKPTPRKKLPPANRIKKIAERYQGPLLAPGTEERQQQQQIQQQQQQQQQQHPQFLKRVNSTSKKPADNDDETLSNEESSVHAQDSSRAGAHVEFADDTKEDDDYLAVEAPMSSAASVNSQIFASKTEVRLPSITE